MVMMRILRLLVILLLLAGLIPGVSSGAMMAVVVRGFQTPESVLYDRQHDVYLVSNINGNPTGTDGNGFISRVSPSGRILALKWIDGRTPGVTLNAPKGLTISGDTLYVADITAVRLFDRRTGRDKGSIEIPGATFMNDLATGPEGSVYATDSGLKPDFSPSGTDALYRIDRSGHVALLAKRPQVQAPNGVAALPGGRIVVVTFNPTGEVTILAANGKVESVRRLPKGQLDGVVVLSGGVLLVSSWAASAVYRVAPGGTARVVVPNVKAPADIGYDTKRNRVLIPLFMDNKVVIQPLK